MAVRKKGRSKASARGRRSRLKGRKWQAELAQRWRDAGLFSEARSTQGEQVRRASLGPKPSDVEGTPFAVEAKHIRISGAPLGALVIAALEQGEFEALARRDMRTVIAVVRPHGCGPDAAIVVERQGRHPVAMRLPDWESRAWMSRPDVVRNETSGFVTIVEEPNGSISLLGES